MQHADEGAAGKLTALTRGEDLGQTITGQRLIQRRDAEACIHRVRQLPGQHLAGRLAHDSPPLWGAKTHGDLCHIGALHVVRPPDRQLAQQVCIDPLLRVRIQGVIIV